MKLLSALAVSLSTVIALVTAQPVRAEPAASRRVAEPAPDDTRAQPERPPAASPEVSRPPPRLDVSAGAGVGTRGVETLGAVRFDIGAVDVGATVGGSYGSGYMRGRPDDDITVLDARLAAWWPVVQRDVASLELGIAAGVRRLDGIDDPALGIVAELNATAVAHVARGVRARLGFAAPNAFIGGEVDQADQQLRGGADVRIARDTWLTLDVSGGGAFGYDGDGAKHAAAAMVGVRYARLADGGTSPGAAAVRRAARAFVSTEWRVLALADHVSHGPGYAVGARLLGGHLRVGIAGFNRPGPLNSSTFATRAVDDQSWNGKQTLALRSDGNFIGVHVAPALWLGDVEVSLPLTVGQAGFGFYLHGDDREAVMDERVSAVENRLFAGRDSSFALGAEAGVQVAYPVSDWLAVHGAVHYFATVGFDTIVRTDYSGASAALGLALTP